MTTNTTTTDLKTTPDHIHGTPPPPSFPGGKAPQEKAKKRGIVWVLLFLIIACVTGYAVWLAGQPAPVPAAGAGGGGGRGGGRGRGAGGPTPVVIAKAHRANVPVYLNGLGNATAFYTVTVKPRVDGQLMSVNFRE